MCVCACMNLVKGLHTFVADSGTFFYRCASGLLTSVILCMTV